MAAANTVEATLRSKFEDGISRGLEQSQKLIQSAFSQIKNMSGLASSAVDGAFSAVVGGIEKYRNHLRQAAEESDNEFKKMGLGAAAFAVGVGLALVKATKAVGEFLYELAKGASHGLEVRNAFEALTKAMDIQADLLLGKLKRATDGIVSGTVLMQNANRVLQSQVPITTEQYAKLTENVFRLAKGAGVDGAQAVDTLTDAIVRGRAGGLQAIGVHVAVRDAISAMAEATGESTNKLADRARLEAYYAELVKQTTANANALGKGFISIEDILQQSQMVWSGFIGSLGQAIGRSGVLQHALEMVHENLLKTGASRKQMDEFTLSANRFFLTFLEGMGSVAIVLSATMDAAKVFWDVLKILFLTGCSVVMLAVGALMTPIQAFASLLGRLPGPVGASFRQMAADMDASLKLMAGAVKNSAKEIGESLSFNRSGASKQLEELGYSAFRTAGQLSAFADEVVRGAGEASKLPPVVRESAEELKKLHEELLKYAELRKQLDDRFASPERKALNQLAEDFRKIDELTRIGQQKRNELKAKALTDYELEMAKIKNGTFDAANSFEVGVQLFVEGAHRAVRSAIDAANTNAVLDDIVTQRREANEQHFQKVVKDAAKEREELRHKEAADALSAAEAIQRTVDLARSGKIDAALGDEALKQVPRLLKDVQAQIAALNRTKLLTNEQIAQLERLKVAAQQLATIRMPQWQKELLPLHDQLQKLQKLRMDPFHQMLNSLKSHIIEFAGQATEAFATFFSDLVTGQEGAGKKLLAAFVGMIGQMLVQVGTLLVQMGVAEVVLAHTLVGRLAGASAAAGYKAIATGIALAVVGGILEGVASSMTQHQQADASTQSGTSSAASNSQPRIINVGAPSTAGQSTTRPQEPQQVELRLKVSADEGLTVRHVENNIRNNGRLRLVIQNA